MTTEHIITEIKETDNIPIKKANHYLSYHSNCRRNKDSTYELTDNFKDATETNYEHSLAIRNITKGKKCVSFNEQTDDAPVGVINIIVALSETEYKRIQQMSFEEVTEFAFSHMLPKTA